MWWDWTEITLFESVLFSILTLIILYFVGYGIFGLVCYASKRNDPFRAFDAVQKATFRMLFGFVFVFLFFYVFAFLNNSAFSVFLVVGLSLIGVFIRLAHMRKRISKRTFIGDKNAGFVLGLIFVASIIMSSMLITGYFGATNDDGADHTLITRVVLDNPVSLLNRSALPIVNFTLNYPSGSHVLSAFFVSLLNVSIQKIIILLTVVFPTLIGLSFYSTLKCLFGNKELAILGFVISSLLTIGFSWGPIGWGGLPVLLSFYLSVSIMGLLFAFLIKEKLTYLNAFLLGLAFFISSQTYPSALLIISIWLAVVLGIKIILLIRNPSYKISIYSLVNLRNLSLFTIFIIPVFFSVPYFYSIYSHNIADAEFVVLNPASNELAEFVKNRISFNWLLDLPSLSSFFSELGIIFSVAPYGIFLIIAFFVPHLGKKLQNVFPRGFVSGLLSVYLFSVSIFAYLAVTLFLPINFLIDFFDPTRVWQHVFIAPTIMTSIVIFSIFYLSFQVIKRLVEKGDRTVSNSNVKITAGALLLILISILSFVSMPVILEQQATYSRVGYYLNFYTVLGEDDILLMSWIKENVSSEALILVSRGDSGQFLTSVTGKQAFCGYNGLSNYSPLMTYLTANSSDPRAVPYMVNNTISHVYIGSIPTDYALENPVRRTFDASQFLETPHFKVVKQIGDAWLFEFEPALSL